MCVPETLDRGVLMFKMTFSQELLLWAEPDVGVSRLQITILDERV